jgi:hypothetical protein
MKEDVNQKFGHTYPHCAMKFSKCHNLWLTGKDSQGKDVADTSKAALTYRDGSNCYTDSECKSRLGEHDRSTEVAPLVAGRCASVRDLFVLAEAAAAAVRRGHIEPRYEISQNREKHGSCA